MKALIQRTIDLLKKRVKENLAAINQNQTRLNEMLNQPISAERTYYIEKNYALNKALLAEIPVLFQPITTLPPEPVANLPPRKPQSNGPSGPASRLPGP